jgi:hypothetical protein
MIEPLPDFVASMREAACRQRGCKAVGLDYADPCGKCPEGHFGPTSFECRSAKTPCPGVVAVVMPSPLTTVAANTAQSVATKGGGPGTELKAMLAQVGIVASPSCSCNLYAAEMDRHGPDWCERHIDTIVDWMALEAKRRGLPMPRLVGLHLVRRAIRRARRAQVSRPLHLPKM